MDGAMPENLRTDHSNKSRKRPLWKALGWSCVFLFVVAVAAQGYYIFLAGNIHTVIPGQVYRCGQLSGEALEKIIAEHHIRTVVNLRGSSAPSPWYLDECRATNSLNVGQEDICFSANRLPSIHELRRLVEVLDRAESPILLHCRHGADRTGLASAVVLLLQNDIGLTQARGQLAARFGHFPVGRLRFLDRFFELYSLWLEGQNLEHSPAHFRQWIAAENFPGACRCTVELLQKPERLICGEPGSLRVRIDNTGFTPWQFRAGTNAGFHAGFIIFDEQDQPITYGRAGLLNALVSPGHSIDLTVVLPALHIPGKYRVLVDMVDEQQGWFYQMGSEPLETDIIALTSG
jgi:protein tyrosine phosphatase (PTP) superfamily phosphohydrolase (DUF442 family)